MKMQLSSHPKGFRGKPHKRQSQQTLSHAKLLQGIAQANYQLLSIDDRERAIDSALQILGTATQVDRVYLLEAHPHPETEQSCMTQRFGWVRPCLQSELSACLVENLAVETEQLRDWYDRLSCGQPIAATLENLSASTRELFERDRTQSMLLVPIRIRGDFWGAIGFDDCHHCRQWTDEEIAVLITMAASIGSLLERERARQQISTLQNHYDRCLQQIAANVPGFIYQFIQHADGSQAVIYASDGSRELFELEPEQIQADFHVLTDAIHPDDRASYLESVARSAETLEPWHWEGRLLTPKGILKWVKGIARARKEGDNIIWDGLVMDISDRAFAQEQLRASEERLQSFFNATFEAVFFHQNGILVDLNPAAEALFGYSARELIGRSVLQLTTPEGQALIRERLRSPSDEPFEAIGLKKDGTVFPCEVRAKDITYRGQPARVVSLRDLAELKRSLAAVKASEAKNRALLNAIPDLMFRFSIDGVYLDFKAEKDSDLAAPPNQIIGRSVYDLIPKWVADLFIKHVKIAIETGETQSFEYYLWHRNPDGSQQRRDWEARLALCGDREVMAIVRDISDRKSSEQVRNQLIASLQQARDRLKAAIDAVPGSVSWIASDYTYLGVNESLASSFGLSPEEFVGQKVGFINGCIDPNGEFPEFVREFFTSDVQQASREITSPHGSNGPKHYLIVAQKYQRGQAAIFVGIDITERQRMEEALRVSEDKFSKAFRSSPDSIAIASLADGRYLEVNDSCLRIFGYEREELIGRCPCELNIWVDPDARSRLLERVQREGGIYNEEVELRSKSGDIRIGLLSAEPIQLGNEACVLTVTNDITERKRAEAQLREKEEQYRQIFEATSDALMINDPETGKVVEVNPACCQMHGYTYEEFIGMHPKDYVYPENYHLFEEFRETVQAGGSQFFQRAKAQRKDGSTFYVDVLGTSFTYRGKPHLLGVGRDVTSQVLYEQKLRAAAEREHLLGEIAIRIRRSLDLSKILKTAVDEVRHFLQADRVFITHLDGKSDGTVVAESVADERQSVLGYTVERELYDREIVSFFDRRAVRAIDDTTQISVSPSMDRYFQEFEIKASLAVRILVDDRLFGLLVVNQCDRTRHWESSEKEFLERLATQLAIAMQQAQLYQQLAALNANLERQVEERTCELQQAVTELQELHKLKDLFLHAVTHDLRTPVMGTLLLVKNLLQSQSEGHTISVGRSVLERTIQGCDRQLNLIDSLLEVHSSEVRGTILHCERLRIAPLVRSLVVELQPLLDKNQATLTNTIPEDLPEIEGDPSQLWRVWENLIVNALNHNPPGIQLTLNASFDRVNGNRSEIRCTIADNGVGMQPEQCENLFELYARGDRARQSTGIGLGLYLCRQIINAHGGQIGAISRPGDGATFWFTLPLDRPSSP
ncbi:PAS domain S-box protein [Oxynema aestuarii AP17]|uniref:histidine kinase n=2 Tax=Oxynema TaxID=1492710 RepID=A0A6H1U3C2_9CYAN|nr:PAS domain S-box protein [Oxynema aestuarii AP17]